MNDLRMSNGPMIEADIESAALSWFGELGYSVLYGPDIEPVQPRQERKSFDDVVLADRLVGRST